MLIRYGYRIGIESDGPLPLILQLTARPERRLDLRGPERFRTDPGLAHAVHLDLFGNLRTRLTAPGGALVLESDAIIADSGLPDPVCRAAEEVPVADLPDAALTYLTPEVTAKAEATLGLKPFAGIMFINQLRLEHRDDTGFSSKLATSIVRDLGGPAKLELGLVAPISGPGEAAIRLGTWLEF
jgi:hypothetical protein